MRSLLYLIARLLGDYNAVKRGNAVRVDSRSEFQEVMRATEVDLQWDQLGLGWIVYPAARR